jgi:hypothetical protein
VIFDEGSFPFANLDANPISKNHLNLKA